MNNSDVSASIPLSIKRKMLIELAVKVGNMNPEDVSKLVGVSKQYVYRVIGKKK